MVLDCRDLASPISPLYSQTSDKNFKVFLEKKKEIQKKTIELKF